MNTGEAFYAVIDRHYGANRDWHVVQAGKRFYATSFETGLSGFLTEGAEYRREIIAYYLLDWYQDIGVPDGHPPRSQIDDEELELFEEDLRELAQSEVTPGVNSLSAPSTKKKSGDKWTSPGRVVCSWPDLDLTARAVMFVMAAHGDNNGAGIFISQRTIADTLGLSTTEAVRRAQKRLMKSGAVTRLSPGRHGKPTQWRLNSPSHTPYGDRGKDG